jgi:hypothetical protein
VILVIWLLLLNVVMELAPGWLAPHVTKPDDDPDQVIVSLHRIRCQQQVAQFKAELRRDAAEQRRRLDAELFELDRQERER